jgi:hypothetical protein
MSSISLKVYLPKLHLRLWIRHVLVVIGVSAMQVGRTVAQHFPHCYLRLISKASSSGSLSLSSLLLSPPIFLVTVDLSVTRAAVTAPRSRHTCSCYNKSHSIVKLQHIKLRKLVVLCISIVTAFAPFSQLEPSLPFALEEGCYLTSYYWLAILGGLFTFSLAASHSYKTHQDCCVRFLLFLLAV